MSSHRGMIHKYELDLNEPEGDYYEVMIPIGSRILKVESQYKERADLLHIWAEVDPTKELKPHQFRVIGTGRPVCPPEDPEAALVYLNTVFVAGGSLVWHVYGKMRT